MDGDCLMGLLWYSCSWSFSERTLKAIDHLSSYVLKRCNCCLEKNKVLWRLLMNSLRTNSGLEGEWCNMLMYWPSLVLWLSHACTHAVNIPLYGMLCDYIIAALQAMISVIIVIGIRVRLRKTITHVTITHLCVTLLSWLLTFSTLKFGSAGM